MPKAIRLNPSWEAMGSMLLEVITNSNDPKVIAEAKAEIKRGLRQYDTMLYKHTDYFVPKEVA